MNTDLSEKLKLAETEILNLQNALAKRDAYIKNTFGRYLTDEVLEEILSSECGTDVGGARRKVSILFADLRGSTEISERMDAGDFIRMFNHFLETMIEIINSWQGNILDFVGDEIVVVFGAPRDNENSARDAVACAVAMQRRMDAINRWNLEQGYPEISMGIGLHTGEAILGNIGSPIRTKYDMIGRNVNLTSRIEGFTKGGQILISAETLAEAGEMVIIDEAGTMTVRPKGIQSDIRVYNVIGFGSQRLF
ncbi:MAG: adenylate/guanylate cyclase domain-containing protein [Oscillospiraceae bacterium]|nr:adenylate/guanylate cyclase domain-containing protein [Oscillospiraceae bacterium]